MALIGYARVSTEDQQTDPQLDELRTAGCAAIFEERASGGSRSRIELARCLERVGQGDTLVVVRIDRLARSLSHLLEVIERLRARGAHFRSLGDPIDTASPQGIFTLQVLGAAAELERALIRERTKAGLKAAKARGRMGGNPGLRARDPKAVRKVAAARATSYLADLLPGLDEWLPVVRRLRPERPWDEVLRAVNAALPTGRRRWTQDRLMRAVRRLAVEGLADPALLTPAPRRKPADRLVAIVAGIARSNPNLTLRAIGAELERLRERTPRGGVRWSASSVAHIINRARKAGLVLQKK
jgi:DNA invertase Pin-like site-specific DNA recombinase